MKKLRILLLGSPQVFWGQDPVLIDRRTPRALLYYLAAHGKALPRSEVTQAFWGHLPDSKAQQRLRENLSRLRRQLPDASVLVSNSNQISLDLRRVEVDQLQFEALLRQVGHTPWQIPDHERLPQPSYELLCQAVDLWRGPHYLANTDIPDSPGIDNWLRETANHIETLCSGAIERLAQHEFLLRSFPRALGLARTGLELNEFHEKLIDLMMQILVQMGLYRDAQEHFEHSRAILQAESLPMPTQMEDLFQLINSEMQLPQADKIEWGLHPSIQAPFVGRKALLEEIITRLQQHQGIFLIGSTGEGKTRLMQEIALSLRPAPQILLVNCRSLDASLPYQPFIDIIRKNVTRSEWAQLSKAWGKQLHTLIPEISTYQPELALPAVTDTTYFENLLLESIRQVFLLLAEKRPLLLIIDDLQWADESSLKAIEYLLGRSPFDQRANLMIAVRQEAIKDTLRETLQIVKVSRLASVYQLSKLEKIEISELVSHVLQAQPPEEFITNLAQVTGGNALFLLESLRIVLERHPSEYFQIDSNFPLTPNLQSLIREQLLNIEPLMQRVLTIAAVMEADIHPDVLAHACQLEQNEVMPILGSLEQAGLLSPSGSLRFLRYRFPNEAVRETILTSTPATQLRTLHRQISTAYEQTRQTPSAAILARHYEMGGELVKAFELWVKAGLHARSIFARHDAQRSFRHAEELLEQIIDQLDDESIYRLYANWAEMSYEYNQTETVARLGQALLHIGQERESALLLGAGLDALGDACLTERKFEEALNYTNLAIPYLEQAGNIFELVEVHLHRGYLLYLLLEFEAAAEALQRSLDFSYQTDSMAVLGARSYAHAQMAIVQTMRGHPVTAKKNAYQAIQSAEISKRFYQLAMAHMMVSFSSYYLADYEEMLVHARKSMEIAQHMQALRVLGYTLNYAASAELNLGQIDAAYVHAREALKIGEQTGQQDVIAMSCRQLGDIYRMLLQFPNANSYYQRGYVAVPGHFTGAENSFRHGYMNVLLGGIVKGLNQINQAIQENWRIGMESSAIAAELCQLLAWLEIDQWQDRLDHVTALQEVIRQRGMQRYQTVINLIFADIAAHNQEHNTAAEYYQQVIKEAQSCHCPWQELQASLQLSKLPHICDSERLAVQERIQNLLANLAFNTRHPDLQNSFDQFQKQIRNASHLAITCL